LNCRHRDVNAQRPEDRLPGNRAHDYHRAGSGDNLNHHRHGGGRTEKPGDAIAQERRHPFPGDGGIDWEDGQQEPTPVGGENRINRRKVRSRGVGTAGSQNETNGGLAPKRHVPDKPGGLVTELPDQ
jgi:hypothetical protein